MNTAAHPGLSAWGVLLYWERCVLELDISLTIAQKPTNFSSYMTVENCFNRNYTEIDKVYFRAKKFRFSFYNDFVHVHGDVHAALHD